MDITTNLTITTSAQHFIKWLTKTLIIITFGLFSTVHAAVTLDKIAAVVNDDVIMLTNVHKQALRLKRQPTYANLPDNVLLKEALESLIMDSLQIQKAKQIGLTVGDSALNATMQNLAQQNKLTIEQFQDALKHEGINYTTFREQIRKQLLISELRKRQLRRNTNITNQAVNDLIANQSADISKGAEFKLKHILIASPAGTPMASFIQAKKDAELLRSQIIRGKSKRFEQINTSNWKASNNLPASQLRVLALLERGQISEVFQDSKGFHIIKLIDKRGIKKRMLSEYHARHILLKTGAGIDSAAQKNKLSEIRNKILAGADFSSMAKQHSQDAGSAVSGGDLGWESSKTYVPEFARTLESIAVNDISKPFKTQFGWHILQVLDKKTTDNTEEMLRNHAKGLLNKNKAEKEYDSWLKQLRNDAFIEYRIKT